MVLQHSINFNVNSFSDTIKTINWCMSRRKELRKGRRYLKQKNRTLKCLKQHYSTLKSMKNVAVLTGDGAFALFFRPHPGDLTAQESPLPGIWHPRQKKKRLGAAGID